jgi:hypothetical protein
MKMQVITSMEQHNDNIVSLLPYYIPRLSETNLKKINELSLLVLLEKKYDMFLELNCHRLSLLLLDKVIDDYIDIRNSITQRKQEIIRKYRITNKKLNFKHYQLFTIFISTKFFPIFQFWTMTLKWHY